MGIYAYAVQIFSDFCRLHVHRDRRSPCCSASSFPQNFNNPYRAASLQDFWRRWHMTLSRWLRDYVYIPLGGNRRGDVAHLSQPDRSRC